MIVERAMRDADGVGNLAQAQPFMAGLRHQAGGGLDCGGLQVAVAIGRSARFWRHVPSYKGQRRNATVRAAPQAEARLATRSRPYCGVMSSSIMARIIFITSPLARALVAAWAAMSSLASAWAASSAVRSSALAGTTRSKKPAVTASTGPNISAVITTLEKYAGVS